VNKKVRIFFVGFMIILFGVQLIGLVILSELNASKPGMSIRGADVVILVTDSYNEAHLNGVKQYLDSWRGVVTIVGTTENVTSDEGSTMIVDIIISDIDDITVYDAIFIPGGEIATTLTINQQAMQLLKTADTNGLVIAGLNQGTLVQAAAGLIDGKKFTTHPSIIDNLTTAGGIYVEGKNVVIDGNIITAAPLNFQELSYAIANVLGYSYDLFIDISSVNEEQGWNYSITIEVSDKIITSSMIVNLTRVAPTDELILVTTIELISNDNSGIYKGNFGILENGYYYIDIEAESIYGNVENRINVYEFSVGSN
jgi:protease I